MIAAVGCALEEPDAEPAAEEEMARIEALSATRPGMAGTPEPAALLVAFHDGVSPAAREEMVSQLGLARDVAVDSPRFVRFLPRPGRSPLAALNALRRSRLVRVAEPDQHVSTAYVPNDPDFSNQWEFDNVGQMFNSTPDADIDAPEAWDINTDCSSIPVAVIDTGVRYNDPDLAANMMRDDMGTLIGYDFVDNDDDPNDDVPASHGTGVAGLIGYVGNNGLARAGTCHQARIMPIRVLGPGGGAVSTIIQGIDYARTHGARIMNLSLTWGNSYSQLAVEALERARAEGILVITAAGNGASNLDFIYSYPASHSLDLDNVVAVAASGVNDVLQNTSNFGLAVDISAPGLATSFAAPLVSGGAALIWATYPDAADYRSVKRRILAGVDHPAALAGRVRFGRLNLGRSMELDTFAPGQPLGLTIVKKASSEIVLGWISAGDDGPGGGAAAAYEIRTSTRPIDEMGFARASEVRHTMVPAAPGTAEQYVLTGLSPGTITYVALRAIDNAGNTSPIATMSYGIRTPFATVLLADGAEGPAPAFAGPAPWAATAEDHATGTKSYSDSPGMPAAASGDSALTQLSPVTLVGELPMLQFRAKTELSPGGALQPEISRDGGTSWERMGKSLTGMRGWRRYRVPLHSFKSASVLVRFRLQTQPSVVEHQGVWVDDIEITSVPAAFCQIDDHLDGGESWFAGLPWGASDEESYSGSQAYSDSPASSYLPSVSSALTQVQPVTLSFADPWLMTATKTHLGAGDLLLLESSSDGGAMWSILEQSDTSYFAFLTGISEWTYRTSSLAHHRNQTLSLRFTLLSDAVDGGESGAWIDDIALCGEPFEVIPVPPPLPPKPLNAKAAVSNGKVVIQWEDAAKNETAYLLQRHNVGEPWKDRAVLAPSPGVGLSMSYVDDSASIGNGGLEYRLIVQSPLGAASPVVLSIPSAAQ